MQCSRTIIRIIKGDNYFNIMHIIFLADQESPPSRIAVAVRMSYALQIYAHRFCGLY
jgi:hypothetical protein